MIHASFSQWSVFCIILFSIWSARAIFFLFFLKFHSWFFFVIFSNFFFLFFFLVLNLSGIKLSCTYTYVILCMAFSAHLFRLWSIHWFFIAINLRRKCTMDLWYFIVFWFCYIFFNYCNVDIEYIYIFYYIPTFI